MRRAVVVLAVLCAAAAGCAGAESPDSATGTGPTAAASSGPEPTATPDAGTTPDGGTAPGSGSPSPSEPSITPSDGFTTTTLRLRPPDGSGDPVTLDVWVADAPALRARGLMDRTELAAGTGMLFEFESDTTAQFWMRDTLVPLSIAFVDADGAVLEVVDMDPCTTAECPRYGTSEPYRRAIEVPQGWFGEAGVTPGWVLDTPGTTVTAVDARRRT